MATGTGMVATPTCRLLRAASVDAEYRGMRFGDSVAAR